MTIIGFIVLILGIILYYFKKEYLFYLSVFFLPFSATSAIDIGKKGEGSSVQLYMALVFVWMVLYYFPKMVYFADGNRIRLSKTSRLLFLFVLVISFSLIMPLYIDGKELSNVTGELGMYEPIHFSYRNITQLLYLIFGVLLSVNMEQYLNEERIYKTIKIYSLSLLFIMFWGILELFCFYAGFQYPAYIFNNSISKDAGGFNQILKIDGDTTKRIASVTLEPSILVQILILALPIYLFSFFSKKYVFNKIFDLFLLVSLILYIPLTTSSTGILGLVFLIIFFVFEKAPTKKYILIAISLLFFVVTFFYTFIFSYFNTFVLDKAESYSAIERISTVIDGWNLFVKYPILGVGWGVVGSHDLIIKLASNSGIIGLSIFYLFVSRLISKLNKVNDCNNYILSKALVLSIFTLIFCNSISGFSYYLGHTWFLFGLALAFIKVHKQRT